MKLSFRLQSKLKNYCFFLTTGFIIYLFYKSVTQKNVASDSEKDMELPEGVAEILVNPGRMVVVGSEEDKTTSQVFGDFDDNERKLVDDKLEEERLRKEAEEKRAREEAEERRVREEEERHREEEIHFEQERIEEQERIKREEEEKRRIQEELERVREEQQREELDNNEPVIYSYEYAASFERFGVGNAHFQYLKNFKSPCWLEDNLEPFPYNRSRLWKGNPHYMKMSCFTDGLAKSNPTFVQLPGMERKYRLRCLPYFMLLGVAKSGTSDIQTRVLFNDHVFKGFSKELYWWDQYRFVPNGTLSDYSDLLDFAVKDMIKIKDESGNAPTNPYWPGVVGEMTTVTLSDVAYWRDDPRNAGLKEPKYLTPHDVYDVIPNVKLIVLMRNPTTRLYSHYNMWAPLRKFEKSPEDFHMRIVNSLKWWDQCNSILPLRNCLYGSPPEMPVVEHTLSSWWPTESNHSGEFRTGLYYLLLLDWLNVFPKEQFLFIRSEDYNKDKLKVMNDEVFPFLGISKVEGKEADRIADKPNAFQQTYLPMLPETKQLLYDFYQPYNDKLGQLLGEVKWTWRDELY